jgi:hypothetical protein
VTFTHNLPHYMNFDFYFKKMKTIQIQLVLTCLSGISKFNQIIVIRIYHQLFGNTTQLLNAFNNLIRFTRFSIQAPRNLAPLVARSLRILSESRVDLLNNASITNLDTILDTLPQITIESEITEGQRQGLVNLF